MPKNARSSLCWTIIRSTRRKRHALTLTRGKAAFSSSSHRSMHRGSISLRSSSVRWHAKACAVLRLRTVSKKRKKLNFFDSSCISSHENFANCKPKGDCDNICRNRRLIRFGCIEAPLFDNRGFTMTISRLFQWAMPPERHLLNKVFAADLFPVPPCLRRGFGCHEIVMKCSRGRQAGCSYCAHVQENSTCTTFKTEWNTYSSCRTPSFPAAAS